MSRRIVMLCTSHDRITAKRRTGLWLEEFVVPFTIFKEAGATITVASPAGGEVPIDARSITAIDTRQYADVIQTLFDTKVIEDLDPADFDAVFIPGGHGPVFDLATDPATSALISAIARRGGTVGAVCHGPAALVGATTADGKPLVSGREVTGFSNAEEEQTGTVPALPFLLETKLREQGGRYTCAGLWQSHVVTDGTLVTGQNPASSAATANAVLAALG
jgi:putative intracellular protease/amidase